jgi:hypothetical protein
MARDNVLERARAALVRATLEVEACLGNLSLWYGGITIEQACQQLAAVFGTRFCLRLIMLPSDEGGFRAEWEIWTGKRAHTGTHLATVVAEATARVSTGEVYMKQADELVTEAQANTVHRDMSH